MNASKIILVLILLFGGVGIGVGIYFYLHPSPPPPPPPSGCQQFNVYDPIPNGWICDTNSISGCKVQCCPPT